MVYEFDKRTVVTFSSNKKYYSTHQQDMFQSQVWFPVLFQGVDTNFPVPGHIRMKDPRRKECFRW